MTTVLQSFVAGRWIGQQAAQALHSAINGKEIAYAHAETLDFAEALQYGRTTGLQGMLAMDFQQRASALRALAKYLGERKEELYAISAHTGATRIDSWVDIEGGTGTLFAYAGMAASELPSGNLIHEGPVASLGKKNTFAGTHILVPRGGVAVHINAFNFPVWGLLEKLKYEKEVIGIYLTGHPLDNYRFEINNFCSHQVKQLALINRVKSGEGLEEDLMEFSKLKGRELIVGGLVSKSTHRMSKTGKPFGSFIFEDYHESVEMVLFGDDYVKLKQFMEDGYFLQLRGVVAERFRQSGNWEFKINSISLLSELRDKLAKVLTVQVPLSELSSALITQLDGLIKENAAEHPNRKCAIRFKLVETEVGTSLEMPSKNIKINPTDELLGQLQGIHGLSIKLN